MTNQVVIDERSETPIITCTFEISRQLFELRTNSTEEDGPKEITVTKFADGSISSPSDDQTDLVELLFEDEDIHQSDVNITEKEYYQIQNIVSQIGEEEIRLLRDNVSQEKTQQNLLNKILRKLSAIKDQEYDLTDQAEKEEFATDVIALIDMLSQIDNLPSFYRNILDDLASTLSTYTFSRLISKSTVIYHEDYDFIPDSIDLNDVNDNSDASFINLLEVSGIKIDDIRKSDNEPAIILDRGSRRLENQLNKVWSQKDINIEFRLNNNEIKLFIRDKMRKKAED